MAKYVTKLATVLFLSGVTALMLASCGKGHGTQKDNGRLPQPGNVPPPVAVPPPAPQPVTKPFNLTDSQTCGAVAPAQLPDDPTKVNGIDLTTLVAPLTGAGLDGWIHGAAAQYGQFVFTYRDAQNFFRHVELSMAPASDDVYQKQFMPLHRHDKVRIKGSFVQNKSPIGHLMVTGVTVLKKYTGAELDNPYAYHTKYPDDLANKTEIYGVVHAQTNDGGAVVLEYQDAILPVFVSDSHRSLAAALFRGDIVKLKFKLLAAPNRPTHITTDDSVTDAIQVVDHIVWCNGKTNKLTGSLVKFPQSEQINMDIYALRQVDANGMRRDWTLVNFDDPDRFQAIVAKLAQAFDAHPESVINGRNQLIIPNLTVTATGTMNEVSPDQANPQILLDGPDSVQLQFTATPGK